MYHINPFKLNIVGFFMDEWEDLKDRLFPKRHINQKEIVQKRKIVEISSFPEELERDTLYVYQYIGNGDRMLKIFSNNFFRYSYVRLESDTFEIWSKRRECDSLEIDYFLGERGQEFGNLNYIIQNLVKQNVGRLVQNY